MPELPEVETITKDLLRTVKGQRIVSTVVYDARVLKNLSPPRFARLAQDRIIKNVHRRGKAIVIEFEPKLYLVVQVKMTGHLTYQASWDPNNRAKETKVVFRLSSGHHLLYNDQRLFGWLHLVRDLRQVPYLTSIGPEPLDAGFSKEWLGQALKERRTPIKTLLMNQSFLAGIGNIYASEILFKARIHPQRSARKLRSNEIDELYVSIRDVLKEAIRYRGTSMRNYRDTAGRKGNFMNRIKVYGREKQSCYHCAGPIRRIVQAGRSTFYCARCQ